MILCPSYSHVLQVPKNIVTLIMNYITTASIFVLVNGSQTNFFSSSWGTHQGDPMSLYIFILYMELLSTYIYHQVDVLKWDVVSISRNNPLFSHLFFANDLTLISKATSSSIQNMGSCMNYFYQLSRQKINSKKSKVIF